MNIPAGSFEVIEQQRKSHQEATVEALERISQLLPQISDTTLKSQIETYITIFGTAMPDAAQNSPESFNDAPTALNAARQYQLVTNKRIEELLAGEELT